MASRDTYHTILLSEILKTSENNTLSLEDLVASWAILSKPEAIAETLHERSDIKSWLRNYKDWIREDEAVIATLRKMIDRRMISVSKDRAASYFYRRKSKLPGLTPQCVGYCL